MSAQANYNPFPYGPDYYRRLGAAQGSQDMLRNSLFAAVRLNDGPLVTHAGRNYEPTVIANLAAREEKRRREEQEKADQKAYEEKRLAEERTYAEKKQAERRTAESMTWKERFDAERKAAIEDYEKRKKIDAEHAKPEKPADPLEEAAKRIVRMTGMADAQAESVPIDALKAAYTRESIDDLAETEGGGTDEVLAEAIQRRRDAAEPMWAKVAKDAEAAAAKAEEDRRKLMLEDAKRTAAQYPEAMLKEANTPEDVTELAREGGFGVDEALEGELQVRRDKIAMEEAKTAKEETAVARASREKAERARDRRNAARAKASDDALKDLNTELDPAAVATPWAVEYRTALADSEDETLTPEQRQASAAKAKSMYDSRIAEYREARTKENRINTNLSEIEEMTLDEASVELQRLMKQRQLRQIDEGEFLTLFWALTKHMQIGAAPPVGAK